MKVVKEGQSFPVSFSFSYPVDLRQWVDSLKLPPGYESKKKTASNGRGFILDFDVDLLNGEVASHDDDEGKLNREGKEVQNTLTKFSLGNRFPWIFYRKRYITLDKHHLLYFLFASKIGLNM